MTNTPPTDASSTDNIMAAQGTPTAQVFSMVDSRTPPSQTKDARGGGCGCGGCGCGGKGKKARDRVTTRENTDR